MKASIYVLDEQSTSGFREDKVDAPISQSHAFDGLYADIIEIQNARMCSVGDVDALIDMLKCARHCFMDGDGERTISLLKTLRLANFKP